jgi:uncharacterized protein (DUF1778 family)
MTTATFKRARSKPTTSNTALDLLNAAGTKNFTSTALGALEDAQTDTLKRARMELKTTHAAKDLLSLAAAVDGMDLTAFVLGPAMDKARKVLAEYATITLNREGQLALAQLLSTPAQPTNAIRELMSLPDLNKA